MRIEVTVKLLFMLSWFNIFWLGTFFLTFAFDRFTVSIEGPTNALCPGTSVLSFTFLGQNFNVYFHIATIPFNLNVENWLKAHAWHQMRHNSWASHITLSGPTSNCCGLYRWHMSTYILIVMNNENCVFTGFTKNTVMHIRKLFSLLVKYQHQLTF